jgi:UDP-N-acetylmuramyl pentapeptide phosphotransferase/UDP-N-acetylglucosamine-1-phosphate transferase
VPSVPLVIICGAFVLKSTRMEQNYQGERHSTADIQLDFMIGLVLFLAFVVCLCVGLQYLPNETPDNLAVAGSLLSLSLVMMLGFLDQQYYTTGKRVVDVQLIRHPTRWPLFLATMFKEAGQLGV